MKSHAFECGCTVTVETDDSDAARTADVFSYQRCPVHSQTVSDSGPIDAYIASFAGEVPKKIIEAKDVPAPKPPNPKAEARKEKKRAYYAAHKAEYAKYEITRLKNAIAKAGTNGELEAKLVAKLKKREGVPQ
jgi:hypothetical protein